MTQDKCTFSRSRGCVQHAAPALPNPPKYHRATIFVFGFDGSDAIVKWCTAASITYTLQNANHIRNIA